MPFEVFLTTVLRHAISTALDPTIWIFSLIAAFALASRFAYWTRVLVQTVIITAIMEGISIWIWSLNTHLQGVYYLVSTASYLILAGIAAMAFSGLIASYRARKQQAKKQPLNSQRREAS